MKVAVFGANGRVGKKVVEVLQNRRHNVVEIEKDTDFNLLECEKIDVAIDFSSPLALTSVVDFCTTHKTPLVCGTTGYSKQQLLILEQLGEILPVVYKTNFSVGVEVLRQILEVLSQQLPNWDCEIVETHHSKKVDSPSGTALTLATDLTNCNNNRDKIAIHSLRCGSVFGTHSVVFAGTGESITITHNAENIDIFALGAVMDAEKLIQQK